MPPGGGIFYGMFRISNCCLRGRQGAALHPLKGLLKKSLKNPQNFQKVIIDNTFLKFFGIQNLSFKKGFGRRRPCPQRTDKPKFEPTKST
jgi:hypothetical protein